MKTGNVWEEFVWHRASDGYRWVETHAGSALVSIQQDAPLRTVSYRPFSKEHSGLFKTFANLELSAGAVLAFANRYGFLGYPVSSNFWGDELVSVPPPSDAFNASPLQPLELANAPGGLVGELLSCKAAVPNPNANHWCWTTQIRQLSASLRTNEHLRGEPRLAPSLQGTVNVNLEKTIGPYLAWSAAKRSFHLRMRPHSLIGALWLQAALAIAERKIFHKCPVCHHPIEISRSGGARTDAVFCSDKCKTRDYRERIAKARKWASAGKLTAAQIAKRLRTDAQTIRKWLK